MALSPFQIELSRLLAQNRQAEAASFFAGGATLNAWLNAPRLSRDLDLFHDSLEALEASWQADRALILAHHYDLELLRERAGYVEAVVSQGGQSVLVQWVRDSAFRFFPLQAHPDLGLALHPFDLATNKILALVGRVEPRDWIDALECHRHISPLGLLAWAACGKDEGWNPTLILQEAARNGRAAPHEWAQIEWQDAAPDPIDTKRTWREALEQAARILQVLPLETLGLAVLNRQGQPFSGDFERLQNALQHNELLFHAGWIGGAWPHIENLADEF